MFENFIHFFQGIGTNGDIFKMVLRLDFLREEMGKVTTEDLRWLRFQETKGQIQLRSPVPTAPCAGPARFPSGFDCTVMFW